MSFKEFGHKELPPDGEAWEAGLKRARDLINTLFDKINKKSDEVLKSDPNFFQRCQEKLNAELGEVLGVDVYKDWDSADLQLYLAWHVFIGSSPTMEKHPFVDIPGEKSIILFMGRTLQKMETGDWFSNV